MVKTCQLKVDGNGMCIKRINERYKAWNKLKSTPINRGLGINVKKIFVGGSCCTDGVAEP